MNVQSNITARTPCAMESNLDAVDRLSVVVEVITLVRMAAHSLESAEMNAIAGACFNAVDIIRDVQDFLHPTGEVA